MSVLDSLARGILISFVAAAALLAAALLASNAAGNTPSAGDSVRLLIGDTGICSATHIGGGRFVTAAHCTGHGGITVQTDSDDKASAEVLWSSKLYDLALLRAEGLRLRAAGIDCNDAAPGTPVYAVGNPLGLDFIRTTGTVVSKRYTGEVRVDGDKTWRERLIADITIAPGSSGGGLFNGAGRLVGVNVGIFNGYRYAIVVPSSTVCQLLGR